MDESFLCEEILTVQSGPLANRVGLHFWNYEAYFPGYDHCSRVDSDCPNQTHQRVLCDLRANLTIPRTLALDLASSIDYGFHFEDPASGASDAAHIWDGPVHSVFRSNFPAPLSQCEKDFTQWTTCFNPLIRRIWRENDMICTLPNTAYSQTSTTDTEDKMSSLSFAQGMDILRPGTAFADEVDNRLRRLLERCDRPSALQLFTEAETGFVGLDLPLLDWWLDELPKRPVITLALYDSNRALNRDARLLRTLRAHQLILATRMESTDEGMTHATWIPLDLSTVPAQNCCFGPSLLAAGISCMTTAIRLAPTSGGLSPNDWIARSQAGGLRRMLTARIGFATSIASDNFLQWRTLSPYRTGQIESGDLSPWREVSLRGLQLKETGNRIIQFANSASGTERPMDLFESTSHSDSTVTYPRMQPGSRVSVMPQLADQPVRLHIDFGSPTYCAQSPTVHVASLLDAPGDKAVEWKRLRNLVDSFKSNRLGSPLEGIESDQWMEFMESGQRNLADPVLGT